MELNDTSFKLPVQLMTNTTYTYKNKVKGRFTVIKDAIFFFFFQYIYTIICYAIFQCRH